MLFKDLIAGHIFHLVACHSNWNDQQCEVRWRLIVSDLKWCIHVILRWMRCTCNGAYHMSVHCPCTNYTVFIFMLTWFSVLPCRTLDITLDLKDPQYPEHNLGTLDLAVTLSPKEGDVRDAVRKLYELFCQITHPSFSSCTHYITPSFRGIKLELNRIHCAHHIWHNVVNCTCRNIKVLFSANPQTSTKSYFSVIIKVL